MEITPAAEADVAPVHELMVQWEREGTIDRVQVASDEAYVRGFLTECFFVARDSGRIVGFVCAPESWTIPATP